MLSEALALMFTVELRWTVAPLAGLVIATVGAVLSTVMAIVAEVVRSPVVSSAIAYRVCAPEVTVVESQLKV